MTDAIALDTHNAVTLFAPPASPAAGKIVADFFASQPHEAAALIDLAAGDKKVLSFKPGASVCLADIQVTKKATVSSFIFLTKVPFEVWKTSWLQDLATKFGKPDVAPAGSFPAWESVYHFEKLGQSVGITHLELGDTVVAFWRIGKDGLNDPAILEFLKAARSRLETPDLGNEVRARAERAKPTLAGPILAAVILGIMAAVNFALGESGIYALRGKIEIPGMVSGLALALMGVAALFRKVKLTYYFMVLSVFWSLFALFLGSGSALYLLLEVMFVVGVGARCRDFGHPKLSSFLGGVFSN